MDFLSEAIEDSAESSIHFWTPCHATPYYSFLHTNVPMWFLDCSPVNRERPEGSESQQLDRNPVAFVENKYAISGLSSRGADPLPDIIVMFSATEAQLKGLLVKADYAQIGSFYHSHLSGDADEPEASAAMVVYRRALNRGD